jgi:hypothetical protein
MRSLLIAAITMAAGTPLLAQPAAPPPGAGGRGPGMTLPTTRAEATDRARERFARLDVNSDGFLSGDELPARGGGGRMMARLDTDGDGKLSAAEFQQQALAMFDRMDSDHDGTISPAERDAWRAQMGPQGRPGGAPPQGG